ncbi:uncharacterized protein [Henckelia pumila]|uniref:uncharacterized protein n=1 Tax=Henckelia pumila TaxID=405737 RepID=UPI003C6DC475
MAVKSNKIVPIKPFEEEKVLVGSIERFSEVHHQSNESELLDHIKRLEKEIKVLKEKNLVAEDEASRSGFKDTSHIYDEFHTEQDVDREVDPDAEKLNEVVDKKVEMNTNNGDNDQLG